jgi:hypothetical protein
VGVEALDSLEIDMCIRHVPGSKENQLVASEFLVLGSVAVSNLEGAIRDELSEGGALKTFTRHVQAPPG